MSDSDLTRRGFIRTSGAALATAVLPGRSPSEQAVPAAPDDTAADPAERPNLILFMPDELRADALACYGNPVTKTPNFDRLASEGAKFDNCHVQFPVCGASRCSMLTGWPTSVRGHRSLYYFLRPEEPNLFRYLKQSGYDVFWFGKNDALAAECFYDSVTEWSEQGNPIPSSGGGARRVGSATGETPGSYSFLFPPGGDRREMHDYALLRAAIDVLERKESDRPFCIFLPTAEPHPPYTVPADFYDMYSPSSLPPLIPPGLPDRPSFHEGIRETYGLTKLSPETFRKIRAVYYGQVSYTDWLLGELLEAVDRTNHSRDTAIFVLSDHGDYAGDYGLVEKWPSGLEDALTHVPLIARVPGGTSGVGAPEMVELYDVMQTCLDLAGVSAQHTHFARSLLPQISGQPGDPGRAAFSEGGYNVYEPQCFEPSGAGGGPYTGKIALQNERPQAISRSAMVRTRAGKLIVRPNGQSELYRYSTDPRETENLFGQRSAATLQTELQQRLLDWYIDTTGIAPMDKDPRNMPPFYPSRQQPPPGWQRDLLDT
ncbi:MAG TPA: sulfatase-like hydrolase/transferase [Rhodothermales bacterium]|nr:sulfatase-like hydrolase/transferase [Rhodothermales bacterium]